MADPTNCKTTDSVPADCAEAFSKILTTLAVHGAKLDAIKEQTTRTNGHVNELYARTDNHAERLAIIETGAKADRRIQHAVWAVVLILLAQLASQLVPKIMS